MKTKYLLPLLAIFPLIAFAENKPRHEVKTFEGERADQKIREFMLKEWRRHSWQIEYRKVSDDFSIWHVKGTLWWVKLESSEHLRKFIDMDKLDKTKIYRFEGIPVDQAYGVITFYLYAAPEIIP